MKARMNYTGTSAPVFVNVYRAQKSIQPAYVPVAWRAGKTNRVVVPARQAGNRFLGSLKGLQIRAPEKLEQLEVCIIRRRIYSIRKVGRFEITVKGGREEKEDSGSTYKFIYFIVKLKGTVS